MNVSPIYGAVADTLPPLCAKSVSWLWRDAAPPPIHLRELEDRLRSSPGLSQKAGIKAAYESIGDSVRLPHVFGGAMVRVGDDCAALQTADGWLLFAIEGLIEGFVHDAPWFP